MVASAPAVISGISGALFSKGPQLYNVVDKHFDDVLDTIEDFRAKKSGKEIGTNILIRVAVGVLQA